jgi:peptide/nickel transport system substrate-binding protein
MKTFLLICFAIAITSILIFSGCGQPAATTPAATTPAATTPPATTPATTPAGTQRYGGTLIIVCDESIDALGYPAEAQPMGRLYYKHALPVMETLLNIDNKENLLPGLAKSWDVSPDGKTVTLHLQQNVKFHDGTDFNAEAVKYNLEAWDVTVAPYLSNVTSIDTPDDYTVVLTLQQYDAFLLQRFATGSVGMIASPTAMKKPTTPETMAEDHMVGTGPFKFVSWKRQDFVKYVKNPDYWQPGKPYLDAIEFRFVADYMTRLLSFEAGEADYTGALYPVEANQLQAKGYRIEPSELTFVWHFFPDGANGDSPFHDLKVREAVEYAIDKKTIAEGIGEGYMAPAYQFAQPKTSYYDAGLIQRAYDPDKAKQLLAEAGYPTGFQTKIITDVRVKMDLVTAVQTYLKDVGIDCELEVADVPRMMSMVMGGWNNAILWQGFPMGSTQMGLYMTFASKGNMVSMYQPEGWQSDWDAMAAEPNDATRLSLLAALNKEEVENLVAIPLIYDHRLYAAQQKVHDIGWSYGQNALWWDPGNAWLSE